MRHQQLYVWLFIPLFIFIVHTISESRSITVAAAAVAVVSVPLLLPSKKSTRGFMLQQEQPTASTSWRGGGDMNIESRNVAQHAISSKKKKKNDLNGDEDDDVASLEETLSSTDENMTMTTTTTTTRGGATASATKGPLQVFIRTLMDARRYLVAAAAARSTSIFLMYPGDTIKTRIQMGQVNPFRLGGIFQGVVSSLIGQVPYGVLTFGSYAVYKDALLERFPSVQPLILYAVAAVAGDLTGSFWLCPSEVMKQQMQAGYYQTMKEAMQGIWSKKGWVGFYEGYFGGVARDVPFRVAQLTTYEMAKSMYLRVKRSRSGSGEDATIELSPLETAFCGAISGTFSAAITAPLDRIKTLLMTDSVAYGGTVATCVAKIWKDDGLSGFFTGIAPRVLYVAPSVVIFFVVNEQVQIRLKHWATTTTTTTTTSPAVEKGKTKNA